MINNSEIAADINLEKISEKKIKTDLQVSPQQQLLLPHKFITHHSKAGLNPLVDAAAYIFSILGKLKQLKTYSSLTKLQEELLQEINTFQDAIKALGYSSDYVLVCRYVICATLDDVICNTSWGSQGQWSTYSLLKTFNQESEQPDRFFIILDRIIKEPAHYIDAMELMYICLSSGFKGNYRTTEFSQNQLEQITTALYKKIRIHRGDFEKALSPFPVKLTHATQKKSKRNSITLIIFTTIIGSLFFYSVLSYVLDKMSHQTTQELTTIGKNYTQ